MTNNTTHFQEKEIMIEYIKCLHPLRYTIDFTKNEVILLNKLKEFDLTSLKLHKNFLIRDAIRFSKPKIVEFLKKEVV